MYSCGGGGDGFSAPTRLSRARSSHVEAIWTNQPLVLRLHDTRTGNLRVLLRRDVMMGTTDWHSCVASLINANKIYVPFVTKSECCSVHAWSESRVSAKGFVSNSTPNRSFRGRL